MKHSFSSLSTSAAMRFSSQDISKAMAYQWNMVQAGYKTNLQRVHGMWTATAYKQHQVKGNRKDCAA